MNRLLSAYRALWDWRCGAIDFVLLAVIAASGTGLLIGAIALSPRSPLALISAAVLIPAVLLLHFSPDDETPDRYGWLEGHALADPDLTVVMHIAGGFRYQLRRVILGDPRAVCGASLKDSDDSDDPDEDSPICVRCALRATRRTGGAE